ncbi:MAG: gamma-glutamyl-gamma-aminobutyrate hydrolase family protein [Coprobacillus sp.]
MYKLAITVRKKEDMTFFMNNTYYQFLSSYFDIELVLPRVNHNYIDIVKRNDVLLLSGGDDIEPSYYQQAQHPLTIKEHYDIETMDFALLKQFYQHHKKIIGICRGIQVINVFFKGTLYQDIPSQYKTTINHSCDHHYIDVINNTRLSNYFPHSIYVNSFHHQNIDQASHLFQVNAISEDGLIEGIENHQILAVQWHPERLDSLHQELFIQMIIDFINNTEIKKK